MERHINRAYDALWAEHQRIHRIHVKVLAQGDPKVERKLLQGRLEDSKYQDKLLDYEEKLSRPLQRKICKLTSYGVKIEKLMDALLRLNSAGFTDVKNGVPGNRERWGRQC